MGEGVDSEMATAKGVSASCRGKRQGSRTRSRQQSAQSSSRRVQRCREIRLDEEARKAPCRELQPPSGLQGRRLCARRSRPWWRRWRSCKQKGSESESEEGEDNELVTLSSKALLIGLRSVVEIPALDVGDGLSGDLGLGRQHNDLRTVFEEGARGGKTDTVRAASDNVDAVGKVGNLVLLEGGASEEGGDEIGLLQGGAGEREGRRSVGEAG